MFSLIQKLFGLKATQRSSSVEATSKKKNEAQLTGKRPLSIDSKKKEHDQLILTTMKNQAIEVYQELDEIATTKKSNWQKSKDNNNSYQNVNYDLISDLSSEGQDLTEDLLENIRERSLKSTKKVQAQLQYPQSNLKNQISQPNLIKENQFKNCNYFPKKPRKTFKRVPSPKKLRRIYQKCAYCQKLITDDLSLKLACIHRFHQDCEKKMRCDNRWQCSICEIKKKTRGSIMLVGHKGKGAFNRSRISGF